jgi:hypothetical protein
VPAEVLDALDAVSLAADLRLVRLHHLQKKRRRKM